MNIKPLLKGIASYIPGSSMFASKGTGGTTSARYCYSVWLRHLTMANKNGLSTQLDAIAELGPGDSLGIGLAALICGANNYYALDIKKFANKERNIEIFNELVELFKKRENIPDKSEFPRVKPYLESYEFPEHILTKELLNYTLKEYRIESIKNSILNSGLGDENNIKIYYFVPWNDPKIIKEESIDMIYSQAVMEYIDDLSFVYKTLYRWLKPNGFMSHEIDFTCGGTSREWNGHWAYPDIVWRLIKGKRSSMINRQPHSVHMNLLQELDFKIICDIKTKDTSGIKRESLAPRFKNMSNEDLITRSAFIQAVKR